MYGAPAPRWARHPNNADAFWGDPITRTWWVLRPWSLADRQELQLDVKTMFALRGSSVDEDVYVGPQGFPLCVNRHKVVFKWDQRL